MPISGYFDCKRDSELIAAGSHFFCMTCLVARPLGDQSPDERYCQGCYDFLLGEARLLPPNKRPEWVPKATSVKMGKKKLIPVPQDVTQIMHTIKGQKANHFARSGIMHTKDLIADKAKENEITGTLLSIDKRVDASQVLAERLSIGHSTASSPTRQKTTDVSHGKRGPRFRTLPVELIIQWAGEGMGSKAIVTRLKSERGIKVHYSTIQRLLAGQRVLV